jgi:hypothetical protein
MGTAEWWTEEGGGRAGLHRHTATLPPRPNHRLSTSPLRKTRVRCAWNRPRRSRLREDATAGRGAALQVRSIEMLEDGSGGRRSVGAVQETLEASFVPDGLFLADDLGPFSRLDTPRHPARMPLEYQWHTHGAEAG